MVRALIRRIVDGVAAGHKYHIRIVFSDGSDYHSARPGEPDITIVFRRRAAEWRMVFGGMFEFLESHIEGDVDILGEQGLRRLVNMGLRVPFGRIEHPLTFLKRRFLEWRQNNRDFAQAKRNAIFHYGLPTEFFHLVLGDSYGYSEGFWREDTRSLDEAQHNNFGGIGLISATFNVRKRPTNYCTIKHIFPGGFIPSLAETLILMEKRGLDVRAVDNVSYHYHRSVDQWLANFEANWQRIRALDPVRFDEKFRRSWQFYLGGASETFEAPGEIINCYHITFVKGHFARREMSAHAAG